jgi:hypothetical protein
VRYIVIFRCDTCGEVGRSDPQSMPIGILFDGWGSSVVCTKDTTHSFWIDIIQEEVHLNA